MTGHLAFKLEIIPHGIMGSEIASRPSWNKRQLVSLDPQGTRHAWWDQKFGPDVTVTLKKRGFVVQPRFARPCINGFDSMQPWPGTVLTLYF